MFTHLSIPISALLAPTLHFVLAAALPQAAPSPAEPSPAEPSPQAPQPTQPSPNPPHPPKRKGGGLPAIIGGAMGALVLIAIVGFGIWYIRHRSKRAKALAAATNAGTPTGKFDNDASGPAPGVAEYKPPGGETAYSPVYNPASPTSYPGPPGYHTHIPEVEGGDMQKAQGGGAPELEGTMPPGSDRKEGIAEVQGSHAQSPGAVGVGGQRYEMGTEMGHPSKGPQPVYEMQ